MMDFPDSFPQRQAIHAQADDKRGKSVPGRFLSDKKWSLDYPFEKLDHAHAKGILWIEKHI